MGNEAVRLHALTSKLPRKHVLDEILLSLLLLLGLLAKQCRLSVPKLVLMQLFWLVDLVNRLSLSLPAGMCCAHDARVVRAVCMVLDTGLSRRRSKFDRASSV